MHNTKGFLALVLHTHLPFVRHPEYRDCLEERWFYDAMTETYIPIVDMMRGLLSDGVPFRLTMSLTPPLVSMMTDELLQQRYRAHLEKMIELGHKEVERTRLMPDFYKCAIMYLDKFTRARELLETYHGNLVSAFREIQDTGMLEIVTCGATHGFLPLLEHQPETVNAQVSVAVNHYREAFGRPPRGIWNGECGYYPGLEEVLSHNGIRYFFVDAHGIFHADRRPFYGTYAPIYTPLGVAAFGRDLKSSKSVWSAEEGYPGDQSYREYYRDIGFDLDFDYIRPYIHESGLRVSTGFKYHRVTGEVALADKAVYDPDGAREKAAEHAGNFMFNREKQIEYYSGGMGRPPIIVAPYDAELFGHWWYEGPDFLNFLLRKMHYDQTTIELITCSEYLERLPVNQVATPSMSSWGHKGYSEVWLEGSNDWIYRHLHKGGERMIELARAHPESDGIVRRALNQAARELLLAQSSDWPFIMKTQTMVHYAQHRVRSHLVNVQKLYFMIKNGVIDEDFLKDLEWKHNIFPNIDYRVYA